MVVRGPTSALSSFLRERGITAVGNRFDRARRPSDDQNEDDDEGHAEQNSISNADPSEQGSNNNDDDTPTPPPIVASTRANRQFKTATTKSKGKKKKKDDDFDDDIDDGKKVHSRSADPNMSVCVRCQTRFRVSIGATTHSLCPECLKLSTVPKVTSTAGQRKRAPKKVKTVHEVSLINELNSDFLSLQDLCIKMISKYIEGVESFDAVSEKAKEKICRIICKHRQLNNQTVKLFCDVYTKSLSLYDCAYLDEDGLCSIAYLSPNLEKIHLGECGHISNDVLEALVHNCRNLTSISLQGCYLIKDHEMATFLKSYPKLQHLNLDNSLKIGKLTIEQASSCPDLEHLSLKSCPALRDDDLTVLVNCKSLKELDVSSADQLTEAGFRDFIPTIGSNLMTLRVAKCVGLNDAFLELISTHCKNLVDLDLSFLENITDEGVASLWLALQHLEGIKLERVFHLTDAAFEGLFIDDSLKEQSLSCVLSLRSVNFNSLVQLSATVFQKLAEQTRSLESLDISWCQQVNDDALETIIKHNPKLQTIKLWGCAGISELLLRDILRDTREYEGQQWLNGIGIDASGANDKGKVKANKYHSVRIYGIGFIEGDNRI